MGYGQEDAHEFLINLLDFIEEDIKKSEMSNDDKQYISSLFDCQMKTIIKSMESDEKSVRTDPVRFLCVSIPNKPKITLEDCLKEFISHDIMDENNLWVTPSGKREKANKVTYIKTFPKYLIFQIKRYNFKKNRGGVKLTTDVYIEDRWESKMFGHDVYYLLQGFILQSGSLYGGHYISFVKIDSQWMCFNDDRATKISDDEALKIASKAYLLCYIKTNIYETFNDENSDIDSNETKNMDENIININNSNVNPTYVNPTYGKSMQKKNKKKFVMLSK